jgi:hypothetical protein
MYRPLGLEPESVDVMVAITSKVREAIDACFDGEVYMSQSVATAPSHDAARKVVNVDTQGVPIIDIDDFIAIRRHVEKQPFANAAITYQFASHGADGGVIRLLVSFKVGSPSK